jgi:hypothetical protein
VGEFYLNSGRSVIENVEELDFLNAVSVCHEQKRLGISECSLNKNVVKRTHMYNDSVVDSKMIYGGISGCSVLSECSRSSLIKNAAESQIDSRKHLAKSMKLEVATLAHQIDSRKHSAKIRNLNHGEFELFEGSQARVPNRHSWGSRQKGG